MDNTNSRSLTPSRAQSPSSKPRVERKQQSGSLKDLVPPLNAARLPPVLHHKQNAVVSG